MADLYDDLTSRGFQLTADGDKLRVSPASKLTPADRQAIIAGKTALLGRLNPPSRFQKYFAQPVTGAAASGIAGLLGGPSAMAKPSELSKSIAKTVVPQTPTQAGVDVGMIAGGALAPEAFLPGLAVRLGASAAGGGLGALLGGESAKQGAVSGALQQGVGEVAAPIANLAGRYGSAALNEKDTSRIGGFIQQMIPTIGNLKKVEQFDAAFRNGEAVEKVGRELANVEAEISKKFGSKALVDMPVPLAMRTSAERPNWVTGKASFDEVVTRIRELNRQGYSYAGDAQQKALAADARREAHELTNVLGQALNKKIPGLGTEYLAARREFAQTSLLTRIFSEPDLYDANGQMNMSALQEYVANRGSAGFREDLVRTFGRDKANKFLSKVYSGAPITGRNVKGGLNMGMSMHPGPVPFPRFYAHPHLSTRVGEVPRRFPKIPPAVPGLIAGQKVNDLIQQMMGNQ